MGCCGQKRDALTNQLQDDEAPVTDARPSVRPSGVTVRIRYLKQSPIIVLGPVTGRRYYFSGRDPIQSVDAGDAPSFVRVGFFRVAS